MTNIIEWIDEELNLIRRNKRGVCPDCIREVERYERSLNNIKNMIIHNMFEPLGDVPK